MLLKNQVLLVAVTSAILFVIFIYGLVCSKDWPLPELCLRVAVSLALFVTSLLLFDIYRFSPANSLSYFELFRSYKYVREVLFYGAKIYHRDAQDAKHAINFQNNYLQEVLNEGKQTKFGRDHNLEKIRTRQEFRSRMPVSTYETYAPYVERVVNGEEDVLFIGDICYLGSTSGTTGKAKLYPKSEEYFKLGLDYVFRKTFYIAYTLFPSIALKKICTIQSYHEPVNYGCGGYKRGPVSAAVSSYNILYVVPEVGYFLTDTEAARYITLLFALKDRDVGIITSFFSPMTLTFFQTMENTWQDLCDDINLGIIRSGYKIPDDELAELRLKFRPDRQRAKELRREFSCGFNGIAKRIWPGLELTLLATTGSFKSSADILSSSYLKGIPNISRLHAGTEGGYGFNTTCSLDSDVEYDLVLRAGFFELLEVGLEDDQTILPHEAEMGKHYELITTTKEGLYRYKTTDVIEAVGFTGQCLRYKFAQRAGDTLFLINEKTPVHIIEGVLNQVLAKLSPDDRIVHFTCTENVNIDRIRNSGTSELAYWVFVETMNDTRFTPDFIDEIDSQLTDKLDAYRGLRESGSAGKVKVVKVAQGTFDKLRAYTLKVKTTTAIDQYKTPRVIRTDAFLSLLLDNIKE